MKNRISKLKTKKTLKILIALILIAVVVGGFYFWQTKRERIFIEDSLINATFINVASTTGGRLFEINTQEGKYIKKGDTIAVVGNETIRSAIDGLVVTVNNQVGGSLVPQSTVAQLIDPSKMRIIGTIDENKGLDRLHVGQVASFTVDAFPGKIFWGFIDEIALTAKQTQLSFSISSERPTQQFQVYVRFPADKYPELKNGMSAKLTVFTDTN